MKKSVGIIGVGIMGTAMARNLHQAGFDVVGYDPAPEALARLEDAGGRSLTSPRAVAEAVPIIIMSLPKAVVRRSSNGFSVPIFSTRPATYTCWR